MIEVRMQRSFQDKRVTIGMLRVVGQEHDPIYTLENPLRDKDSCIPAGIYTCVPYTSSKHSDVYEVTDVPGRSYILFHSGNFESDTLGCILVGNISGILLNQPAVMDSKACMDRLKKLLGKNDFRLILSDISI